MIRGLVFDIDDTLYDEREYVRSGFFAVAQVAGHSDGEATALADWLGTAFEAGIRGDTFDRLRASFPEVGGRVSTAALVDAYRAHLPDIALSTGVPEMLDRLEALGLRLGVLSDGHAASQMAKVAALGLERWFDPILLTGSREPRFAKPGTAGFEAIAQGWRLAASELVYVADNPEKDFAGPRRLGWMTVRLAHPRQLRHRLEPADEDHQPDVVIGAPADLLRLLSLGE